MQTGSLPGTDVAKSLWNMHSDKDLVEAADYLWRMLLKQVQTRTQGQRKGPGSQCLKVTKADISHVRLSLASEFWRKARHVPQIGRSGSLLFWCGS